MNLKLAFCASWPESKLAGSPGSEVAVWAMESMFVQHTVSPGFTVTGSGENAKLAIVTCVSLGSQATAGDRVEEAWLEAGKATSRANSASESPLPISICSYDPHIPFGFLAPD
jgi:hypothetical protein